MLHGNEWIKKNPPCCGRKKKRQADETALLDVRNAAGESKFIPLSSLFYLSRKKSFWQRDSFLLSFVMLSLSLFSSIAASSSSPLFMAFYFILCQREREREKGIIIVMTGKSPGESKPSFNSPSSSPLFFQEYGGEYSRQLMWFTARREKRRRKRSYSQGGGNNLAFYCCVEDENLQTSLPFFCFHHQKREIIPFTNIAFRRRRG